MKKTLLRIALSIDSINDRIGRGVAWLTTILMIVICIDVVLRYLFSNTKTWVIELEWHIFSVIFLIGAAYTLLHDKHVRVDLFYEKMSDKRKALVDTFGLLLFLIPWAIVIIYYGFEYTANSFSFRQGSPQPGGLPARYVIKSCIVIGFVLLVFQGLSEVIKSNFQKDNKGWK